MRLALSWFTPAAGVGLSLWVGVLSQGADRLPPRFFSPAEVRVSTESPFPATCNGQQTGTNYRNAEVEPWIAVDPNHPLHLIGVWQQDRWSNGGASGLVTGASFDGGQTWTRTIPHFSQCAGGTAANGGNYERATDPWVTFAPDGTAYQVSYSFDQADNNQAVLVSRSTDGGLSWSEPVTLIRDSAVGVSDDKESITADRLDARYVYAAWDRLTGTNSSNPNDVHGPVWFARSTDGGSTWEPARMLYDPGPNEQTIGNQVLVLNDGSLLDVFTIVQNASAPSLLTGNSVIAFLHSVDKGKTWSSPVTIATEQPVGIADVKTGTPVRSGTLTPSVAVAPDSGIVYVVWEDGRFSGFQRDGVALSKSLDGGATWSQPIQVNQAPGVQAFNPTVAVGPGGIVGVLYSDFRNDTADAGQLLTNYWGITSEDGGASWRERALSLTFNLAIAPVSDREGYFLGDYEGLAWAGHSFVAFFVAANTGNTGNRTDVFAESRGVSDVSRSFSRREVNLRTVRMREPENAAARRR